MTRADVPPKVAAAVAMYAGAPVGQQLAKLAEREGRCWRSATRFLAALREHQADGDLLCWAGAGWTHGAIRLAGTQTVVDWTVSQFEPDPAKAAAMDFPVICTAADLDRFVGATHAVLRFEDPFWRDTDLVPEFVLPWEAARQPIAERDPGAR
jgi:hypothetical protein